MFEHNKEAKDASKVAQYPLKEDMTRNIYQAQGTSAEIVMILRCNRQHNPTDNQTEGKNQSQQHTVTTTVTLMKPEYPGGSSIPSLRGRPGKADSKEHNNQHGEGGSERTPARLHQRGTTSHRRMTGSVSDRVKAQLRWCHTLFLFTRPDLLASCGAHWRAKT